MPEETQGNLPEEQVNPIPAGSIVTEEMVRWYMAEFACSWTLAVNGLCESEAGGGQLYRLIAEKYPEIDVKYREAKAAKGEQPEYIDKEVPVAVGDAKEETKPEETAPVADVNSDGTTGEVASS